MRILGPNVTKEDLPCLQAIINPLRIHLILQGNNNPTY